MITIYALTDPRTKAIRYIGKSIRVKGRYLDHLNDKSKTHKTNWITSLRRIGLKPGLLILQELDDNADWQSVERDWIKIAKDNKWDLVNSTDGGDGVLNVSGEGALKMKLTWVGRKHKPESLEKMRLANIGKKKSEESKMLMSKIMKGRKITWKDKISNANRKFDINRINELKKDLANGMMVVEAAKKYNVHRTTISKIKLNKYP